MQEAENSALSHEEDSNSKVYELGYLLVPNIAEEDVSVHYGNIKDLVSSFGGEIITDEMPKMIPLAYSMTKVISNVRSSFNKAYFGWTKFTMEAEQILKLKKHLDLDPNFIRFLIIKTVKENTIAAKRFVRGDMYRRTPSARKNIDTEPAAPITKEEIDKEIDALISA